MRKKAETRRRPPESGVERHADGARTCCRGRTTKRPREKELGTKDRPPTPGIVQKTHMGEELGRTACPRVHEQARVVSPTPRLASAAQGTDQTGKRPEIRCVPL